MNIKHIIKGNWLRLKGHETQLSKTRKSICYKCDRCINVMFVGKICSICGCPIKSKVLVEDEKCPNGKW